MTIAPTISLWLMQAAQVRDTVITKMVPPERSLFDYTSGTLQIIVLLLAVVVLAALAMMVVTLRRGLASLQATAEKFYADARPIITKASEVVGDAREVVAMLKTDAERITDAAGALSDQMLDVVESVERRTDDINAVLDVVQGELEETVLSTTAALRGVRLGGRAVFSGLVHKQKQKTRRRDEGELDEPRLRDRHSRQQRHAGD